MLRLAPRIVRSRSIVSRGLSTAAGPVAIKRALLSVSDKDQVYFNVIVFSLAYDSSMLPSIRSSLSDNFLPRKVSRSFRLAALQRMLALKLPILATLSQQFVIEITHAKFRCGPTTTHLAPHLRVKLFLLTLNAPNPGH